MRFASLGSGSRGNGTLIEDGDTCLLVDLGFTLKESVRRLRRLGRQPEDVSAILVTHEHADHVHGVGAFARKFGTPVFMTPGTHKGARLGTVPKLEKVNCHRAFRVGSVGIEPVPVPHDAREPCQYLFMSGGVRVGLLTDLGHITPFVAERYDGCDGLMLECNHDVGMLRDGPYPWPLKQRVGGIHGHLNNVQAAGLLDVVNIARIQQLVLCHLSEQNNLPDLATQAVEPALSRSNARLTVAAQESGFDWIEVGS
ncbi:MAG: MBL fold metallo-hydrolase [Pseudomonadales bacterium]|nr:MBL fold metallo-hydrolase [Pseudomonadales bacterium]